MSTPQRRYVCGCGNSYATEAGLRQHERRYCRGVQSGNNNSCPICGDAFNTYRGMRQHMRIRHPHEYNRELELESGNARSGWTEDEVNNLARAEAEYEGEDLYGFLLTISHRTKDAIKGRRRQQEYKDKVNNFKEELRQSRARNTQNLESSEAEFINNVDASLKEAISNIEDESLDESCLNLKHEILHGNLNEARAALDVCCDHIINRVPNRNRNHGVGGQGLNFMANINEQLGQPNVSRRVRRRLEYKAAQFLYRKDQKAYADRLLDGRDLYSAGVIPPTEELRSHYSAAFETPSIGDNEQYQHTNGNRVVISSPITADEILAAMKTSKSNAAGYDGLTLNEVKRIPTQRLALIYNAILLLSYIPPILKKGRTILIPKKDKDLHMSENWRPITIPPIIIRILNKILALRFNNVQLNAYQRGFQKIDGCFANFATLETIIKQRRSKGQPLTIVTLDLSKAFDTVSHESIGRALSRLNIDIKTRNLIKDGYTGCTTSITCGSTLIGNFEVNRGVKQGDPYSPFIFNAVLDELLEILNSYSGVPIIEGTDSKVCALAYADDIILATTNIPDAQRLLDIAKQFLEKRGLHININKCTSLILNTVPSKKKVYAATEPKLNIDGNPIPVLGIGQMFSYLGQEFSTTGLLPCNAENLTQQLSRILKAPLKPYQKFAIINKFLIPRYIASVQRPNINKKILTTIDKKIRSSVRKILSLPLHTSNAIIYATQKDGGLGVFNFSSNIPRIILKRWEHIRATSNLSNDVYSLSQPWVNRLKRLVPEDASSKKEVQETFARELQQCIHGKLFDVKHHPACRRFINDPPVYWTAGDYIKAIHLRFNVLPSKGAPYVPHQERLCRGCGLRTESLSHILQRCPTSHTNRIRRHDFVVRRLKRAAEANGWEVIVEPRIRGSDGVLKKPDLILLKNNILIVSDVGVHWEFNCLSLQEAYSHKVAIYTTPPCINRLQEMYPGFSVAVMPLIVGARGSWCELNKALTDVICLTYNQIQDIITTAMRGSWNTHHDFMRYVWRRMLPS